VLLGGDDDNTPRVPSGIAINAQRDVFVTDTVGPES
jgi:hypothetical protein